MTTTKNNPILWGVDSALKGIAIVKLNGDDVRLRFLEPEKDAGRGQWGRLESLHKAMKLELFEAKEAGIMPAGVWIESAAYISKSNVVILSQVVGAVRLACGDFNIPTFEVPSSTWKRDYLGTGKASKEDVWRLVRISNPFIDDLLEPFKAANRQDLVDALAIARFGQKKVAELS